MKTSMFRRRRFHVVVVVAVVAAGATWLGTARSGAAPAPPGLAVISNPGGAPIALTPARDPLVRAGATRGLTVADVRPLGNAGPISFYRVGATGCYATGPGLNGEQLASLFCTVSFPSASQPVIVNLQRQGASDNDPNPLVTAYGLAADAVATVEFRDSAGNALKTAAVRNNLFRLEAVPAGDVASFVALDGSRNVVYSTPAE